MSPSVSEVFESDRWHLAVRTLGVAALLAILAAPAFVLFTDSIALQLESVALRFDGDQSLDAENRLMMWRMVRGAGGVLFVSGAGLLTWVWVWVSLARRLPDRIGARIERRGEALLVRDVSAIVLGVSLLALFSVRALGRGFGYDEIVTVQNFVEAPTWWDVFSRTVVFNNHIPFSALSRTSRSLFGTAEWAYRLPAFLLGALAVPAMWLLGRRLFSRAAANVGLVLLATAPLMVEYSASARGYTGLLLFSTISTYLLLLQLGRPPSRILSGYVASASLAVWFHLYGILVVVAHALYLVWLAWRATESVGRTTFRSMMISLLAVAGLSVLLYAPVLPRLFLEVQRRGNGSFQPDFPWTVALELSGGLVSVCVLVGLGLVLQLRDHQGSGVLLGLLLGVAITVPWLMRPFDLYPRFFMFLLPLWTLVASDTIVRLATWGEAERSPLPWLRRGIPAVVLIFVCGSWMYRSWTAIPEEGYRAAALTMMDGASAKTALVSMGLGGNLVSYYVGRPVPSVSTPEEVSTLATGAEEVRVAYRRSKNDVGEQDLRAFLETRSKSYPCGNVTVYKWSAK